MPEDISDILRDWDFDPKKTYRKIIGEDGREMIQVRVDNAAFQGILQMELDGRTFTLAGLREHVAAKLNRPEMLEAGTTQEGVLISFAEKDAAQVRFCDGQVALTLSIAALSKSPRQWKTV